MDYTNISDVRSVAIKLLSLTDREAAQVAAYVIHYGLMKPRGFAAKLLCSSVRFGAWIRRQDPLIRYIMVFAMYNQFAKDIIEQTAMWMVNGTDQDDEASAGGFNKEEFGELLRVLDYLENVSP